MSQYWKLTYAMDQEGFLGGFLPIFNTFLMVAASIVIIFLLAVALEQIWYREKGIGFMILAVATIPAVLSGYHFILGVGWEALLGMVFATLAVSLCVALVSYLTYGTPKEEAYDYAVRVLTLTACFCLVLPLILRLFH